MKRIITKIRIILFVSFITLPMLTYGFFGMFCPEMIDRLSFDVGENRELSPVPELNIETYTADAESYYNDHLPFRSSIITANTKKDSLFEGYYRTGIQPVLLKIFHPGDSNQSNSGLAMMANEEAESVIEDAFSDKLNEEAAKKLSETGHEYKVVEEKEATCTEDGFIIRRCDHCDDEIKEIIKATGHEEEETRIVEASYQNYGHTEYTCKKCKKVRWTDFTEKLVDTSYLPPVVVNNMTIFGRYNWLFFSGDDCEKFFTGANLLSDKQKAARLEVMQQLQDICDERGITLIYMMMPNKAQIYPEYMPTYEIVSEVKRTPDFAEYVAANSDMTFIYPQEELLKTKLYYDTYYPYDPHWNNVGGFVGAMKVLEALGMETTEITDVTIKTIYRTPKSLVDTGGLDEKDYGQDWDFEIEYKPEISVVSGGGLRDLITGYDAIYAAKTTSKNNRKFVMIGDSFRIPMIQYLEKEFSDVTFIQRQNIADGRDAIINSDILVVSCVERFDKYLFKTMPDLIGLFDDCTEENKP